jgi:hypothetical protein
MTIREREERGSTRLHSVLNLLWKSPWSVLRQIAVRMTSASTIRHSSLSIQMLVNVTVQV